MNTKNLLKELSFKATRSSGAGGQHVNKVSSKIELFFDLGNSEGISEEQKELLLNKLANRLNKDGVLLLTCDESRSQHKNKELAIQRFLNLIKEGLKVPKKRKPTKPSKTSLQKKAESKRKTAFKKALRRKPDLE